MQPDPVPPPPVPALMMKPSEPKKKVAKKDKPLAQSLLSSPEEKAETAQQTTVPDEKVPVPKPVEVEAEAAEQMEQPKRKPEKKKKPAPVPVPKPMFNEPLPQVKKIPKTMEQAASNLPPIDFNPLDNKIAALGMPKPATEEDTAASPLKRKETTKKERMERANRLKAQRDLILKQKQDELKSEWDDFTPSDTTKEGNRKEIIKRGLDSLKIRESSKGVFSKNNEEMTHVGDQDEQKAREKLSEHVEMKPNPGGLSHEELARRKRMFATMKGMDKPKAPSKNTFDDL